MTYLGDFAANAVVDFMWSSNGADGASITRSTNGTISVYKGNSTTQSTAGITDTEDFDSLTGIHHVEIDLEADEEFYESGANYTVVLAGATIDGKAVNAVLAHFSIENRHEPVQFSLTGEMVREWLGMESANFDILMGQLIPGESLATVEEMVTAFLAGMAAEIIDGMITRLEAERIALALAGGKSTGAQSGTPKFYGQDGVTARVNATQDEHGNRTNVILDGSA